VTLGTLAQLPSVNGHGIAESFRPSHDGAQGAALVRREFGRDYFQNVIGCEAGHTLSAPLHRLKRGVFPCRRGVVVNPFDCVLALAFPLPCVE
jgi:hypothetical protein